MNFQIIKKVYSQYIQSTWKTKTFFVFLFTFIVSVVSVIEPLFFSDIIWNIESFYDTGIMPISDIIKTMIIWWMFIIFNIIILYVHRYYIVDVTTLKTHNMMFKKYSKKIFNMYYWVYLDKKAWSIFKNFDKWIDVHFQLHFELFLNLLKSFFSISTIIIIMLVIDWRMALIALSMLPVMVWLWLYFNYITNPRQKELHERWNKAFWIIWDSMNNFLLFKTLNLNKVFSKKVSNKIDTNLKDQFVLSKQWSISNIYTAICIMISRILVIWFWINFLMKWEINFYTLFVIFSYLWWIYFPLWIIFNQLRKLQEHLVSAKIFYDEFEELESDYWKETWKNIENFKWNIEFENVKFSYIKWKKIFSDLSFKIKSWEKVAFVWNTWSWKSSIVNLILRFWDIEWGKILIDWEDSSKINKTSIRENIWVVSQDNSLFNLSIKENLLFAKPNASDEEIKKALNDAQANFVFDLDKWLETVIWERWLKLSGWEKQRISIARLFLKNPKLLILDEATSALDNKTEKLIQKALDKLMKWRTSIVVAHRLSTIKNSDKIHVLKKWKIIETWNYEELMENKWDFFGLANPEHLIIN